MLEIKHPQGIIAALAFQFKLQPSQLIEKQNVRWPRCRIQLGLKLDPIILPHLVLPVPFGASNKHSIPVRIQAVAMGTKKINDKKRKK